MSVWRADRSCHQSVCVSLVLPEEDGLRICLRASAWLWLMGCMTRELALILGLYTFKWKDSIVSIRPLPVQQAPWAEVTAAGSKHLTRCPTAGSFCTCSVLLSHLPGVETPSALIRGFQACLLSL